MLAALVSRGADAGDDRIAPPGVLTDVTAHRELIGRTIGLSFRQWGAGQARRRAVRDAGSAWIDEGEVPPRIAASLAGCLDALAARTP